MDLETFALDRRYCGPTNSGNGGYTCGRIARHLAGVASVRLHLPPPLETRLRLHAHEGAVQLFDDAGAAPRLIAEGRAATLELTPPPAPDFAAATRASAHYLGFRQHAFGTCFVCGPLRAPGDGLRIFAGPESASAARADAHEPGLVAAPWVPDESLVREDGSVADEFLWAALDCPSAYASMPVAEGRTLVLGTMIARLDGEIAPGQHCVVIGWPLAREGRKRHAGSALFGPQGDLVGLARATWIEVDVGAFRPG